MPRPRHCNFIAGPRNLSERHTNHDTTITTTILQLAGMETVEELQARHRKEQRDLQSRITQKKKQANKKTRKGVNDECDRLEADLKQKQQDEIDALNGEDARDGAPGAQLKELKLEDEEGVSEIGSRTEDTSPATEVHNADKGIAAQSKKPSRQKARLARRAAEQEELARQAAEEAKNLPDLKQQERERMLVYMKERGLQEKEIRADGHCLYSAVADQLVQLRIPLGSAPGEKPDVPYKTVRSVAAEYIEEHEDDYAPFLEEPLVTYVHKVRDTNEWGGQLELMALAKAYDTNINVLQDFGRVEMIDSGSNDASKTMWLGYYKHGFGLGEHYNSLRKVP
jgi:OTU domain-containing protein 6